MLGFIRMKKFTFCFLLFLVLGLPLTCAYAQAYQAGAGAPQHQLRLQHRRYARGQAGGAWWRLYADGLKNIEKNLNILLGADVTYNLQRAAPGGKQTAVQGIYYPFIEWKVLPGGDWGEGVINANYTLVQYWGAEAASLQTRIGAAAGMNDGLNGSESFSQLTYTHTLPGRWDWLSLTVGQFSVGNFDSTSYLGNQQTSLMNASFAQNLSSVYPSAGLGVYGQADYAGWSFAAGYQDATNLSGRTIRFNQAFDGKYTLFAALNRTLKNGGFYNVLYYHQPAVPGAPQSANGVSLSAQQPLGRQWVVFARGNYSSGNIAAVSRSFAAGGGLRDPLKRNEQDVVLFGAAFNRLNPAGWSAPLAHKQEVVFELQWVWNLTPWISLTPDFQLYPKTAQKGRRFATAAGLRTTIML